MRTEYCGLIDSRFVGQTVTAVRLGASPPRPRRRHLHRPARPRGPGAGGVRSRPRRGLRAGREDPQRVLHPHRRPGASPPRRHRQPPTSSPARSRCCARSSRSSTPRSSPPFQLDDEDLSEITRLTHRVLDLRRPQMQKNLMLRYRVTMAVRKYLDGKGFIDIETPMLTKSTPEGARDYLVPSRVHAGHVLRAAAVAAAVQAAADGRRLRPLLPDHQVLPRRGPARRPPAGVHADRLRNLVPRRGGDPHDLRGHGAPGLPRGAQGRVAERSRS